MALNEADGLIIAAAITEAGALILRWRSRKVRQSATEKLVDELTERLAAQNKDTIADLRQQNRELRTQLGEKRNEQR